MGVKGLWRLLANCETPVPLESLEHKILAIDVSIWLHQAVRGFRGFGGGSVANAHLLTLFHRICKLLFYRIRPVFVFDGGVPQLKRQTLSSRRLRREAAAGKAQKVRDRLLTNLLRSQAVRSALGKKGPGPNLHYVSKPVKKDKDLFELPPLAMPLSDKNIKMSTENDSEEEEDLICRNLSQKNLHNFEYDDNEFKSLPLETQHVILSELHVTRKENSWHTLNEMPQESNSFSSFQMERLLKRFNFQKNLDNIRTEIKNINTAEIEAHLFGDLEKHVSLTHKIISEDSAHSILVKNIKETTPQGIRLEIPSFKKANKSDIKQDFLTELAKHGIVCSDLNKNGKRDFDSSFSLSSDDEDSLSDEDLPISSAKKKKLEEVAFLKAVDYVLDDSELTQEEILSLIKQTQLEVESETVNSDAKDKNSKKKNFDLGNPSTSANAPGMAYNSNAESSTDDDDFIDVSDLEPDSFDNDKSDISHQRDKNDIKVSPQKKDASLLETSDSNVDKILGAKTDSLYIKILQQKLGDVVQTSNTKSLVDTRKSSPSKENNAKQNLSKSPTKGNVAITLSFRNDPQKSFDDDIFSDVFNEQKLQKANYNFPCEKNGESLGKTKSMDCSDIQNTALAIEKGTSVISNNGDIKDIIITDELKQKVSELVREEVENIIKNSSLQSMSHNQELGEIKSSLISKDDVTAGTDHFTDKKSIGPVNEQTSGKLKGELSEKTDLYPSSTSNLNDIIEDTIVDSSTCNTSLNNVDDPDEIEVMELREDDSPGSESILLCSEGKEMGMPNVISNANLDTDDKEIELIEQPHVIPLKYTVDDLNLMENELAKEQTNLMTEIHNAERVAVDISDQVYGEAQELLKTFGLPYLVAPMEAEAQCAFLDVVGLTHGSITNDSDIFLFGGKRVYKNFFNQDKHVECFTIDNIKHNVGLDRNKMITLALLTGSDYSVGIESVGAVLGMEILSEFPGSGVECLKNLKKWWNNASKNICNIQSSKTKQRLSRLYFPESFPNENVVNAYLEPEVDESQEKFTWGIPNVENLRTFTADKFGWNRLKTDEIILPVFKKLGIKETQMRIESYFNNIKLVKDPHNKSKRLKDAIARAREETDPFKDIVSQNSSNENQTKKRTLLMDPSEGSYGNTVKRKRGRKKEKPSSKGNNKAKTPKDSSQHTKEEERTKMEEPTEVPLSKEERKKQIYIKLQEKEKIVQLEKEKMEKSRKRALAIEILSKSKAKK